MEAVILKQVRAIRLAARLAETLQGIMPESGKVTLADEIYGQMVDSLVLYGDRTRNGIAFDELRNMLSSDMSDVEIAKRICAGSEIPKPNIVDDAKRFELAEKNGYYLHRDCDKRSDGEKIVKVYERLNKATAMLKSCEKKSAEMQKVISDISYARCKECVLGRTGVCIKDDCKWFRYKNGDFS